MALLPNVQLEYWVDIHDSDTTEEDYCLLDLIQHMDMITGIPKRDFKGGFYGKEVDQAIQRHWDKTEDICEHVQKELPCDVCLCSSSLQSTKDTGVSWRLLFV